MPPNAPLRGLLILVAAVILPDTAVQVSVNGQRVPASRSRQGKQNCVLIDLKPGIAAMGGSIGQDNRRAGRFLAAIGNASLSIRVGDRFALTVAGGRPARMALECAPVARVGQIWAPLSLFRMLGATVRRTNNGYELTTQSSNDTDKTAVICKELGLVDLTPFRKSTALLERLRVSPGEGVRVGDELVINVRVERKCFIQIYELVDGLPEPILGRDEEGKVLYYPERFGKKSSAIPVADRYQVPIQADAAGRLRIVALATDREVADPLGNLKAGKTAGNWSLKAAETIVKD